MSHINIQKFIDHIHEYPSTRTAVIESIKRGSKSITIPAAFLTEDKATTSPLHVLYLVASLLLVMFSFTLNSALERTLFEAFSISLSAFIVFNFFEKPLRKWFNRIRHLSTNQFITHQLSEQDLCQLKTILSLQYTSQEKTMSEKISKRQSSKKPSKTFLDTAVSRINSRRDS